MHWAGSCSRPLCLAIIAASRRIIEATQLSMDEVSEEAMRANAVAREKLVAILNSKTLDPLPHSFNPSNF